jgi:glycosyltransferase involved in cell wall biosynthesis
MKAGQFRTLYVETAASVGGSVISLYELVRGLDRSLYEPVVLFHEPNPCRERFRALGVNVITLNERPSAGASADVTHPNEEEGSQRDIAVSLSRYGKWLGKTYRTLKDVYLLVGRDWPLARRLARVVRDERIDVVHHNNTLRGGRATVLAARLAGVPLVCHVRMLYSLSPVERRLARLVNAFIYISTAVEQAYREGGIRAERGEVVHNPIDVEAFARSYSADRNHPNGDLRAELGLDDQDRVVSNVGRLCWWKGHDDFLRAMAEVRRSQPNAKALIVGSADSTSQNQTYYRRLQQLATDLRLSNHVVFTGFRADIPRVMAASDVVVHSASEPEPFGRVVAEAMAAGRPVVATAGGGVLDMVEDGVTGLLVPPGDVTSMAKAIEHFLQDREQARIISQRAQRRARERFSVERHVTAVQRIYRRILE